jgi:flagellar biosynthesis chaperone FliJ
VTVDLRRFEYPLEPIRRQRQWRLDALRAELGQVQRRVDEAERALAALDERVRTAVERTARLLAERVDPVTHPRGLRWIVRLRRERAAADEALAALRIERARVQAACLAEQQRLEVIEEHRSESVSAFAREEEGRMAREADRDWLLRSASSPAPRGGAT